MSVYIGAAARNDYSAMRGPCPEGFHVPTYNDWDAMPNGSENLFQLYHLPPGFEFSSTSLRIVEHTSTSDYRICNRVSVQTSKSIAQVLRIYSGGGANHYPCPIVQANHIRPFKDIPAYPDNTWTKVYEEEDECEVYHNATLGLITVHYYSTDDCWIRKTMADKNLGATVLYNYGDTQSTANCGYIYQHGNNYGFDPQGTISTSSTVVDCTGYGPGNYYSNNLMRTSNWNQTNKNMWGGETGVNEDIAELKSAYIGDYDLYTTFTISRTEQSNMSSGWTYSDDAAELTAGSAAFDEFFGYSAVRLSAAGVETAEVAQTTPGTLDLSQLGTLTSGDNVMIKFPRRGIKMTKDGSTITLSITDNPHAEAKGFQYYAHSRGTFDSPVSKNYMYLGAFKGYSLNNILKSWSGQGPSVSMDQGSCISHARANDGNDGSAGYDIIGFYQRQYINALYMMKYGNPDSQSVVGAGYTGGTSPRNTGGTVSQTAATYGTSSGTQQVKLFGLEDRRGNVREWIGGMCTDGSKNLYTALSGFVSEIKTVSPYANTGTKIQHKSGNCIIAVAGNNEAMFGPITTTDNTSFNTYYCDYAGVWASNLASAGDYFNRGAYSGAFNIYVGHGTSASSSYVGSRLMYL